MKRFGGRFSTGFFLLTLLTVSVLPQIGSRLHHFSYALAPEPALQTQPKFQLDCTVPALTSAPKPIDKACGNSGSSPADSNSAKQNLVKNRFCLPDSPTTPIDIDFDVFDRLQKEASDKGIPFGRKFLPNGTSVEDLPPDRSLLVNLITVQGQQIGEGSLVRFEGFVFKAQHSNVSSGESVNCNTKGLSGNDIHIALARTKTGANGAHANTKAKIEKAECETVTAEITPHHRSTTYNRFDTNPSDFLLGKPQKHGQDKLKGHPLPLQGARVRLTGQLFFDGSHSPCTNGKGGPARRSIWEVHPVFAIEVFEPSQNKFITFEEWSQLHGN